MEVYKFGGASIKDAPAIRNMEKIIRSLERSDNLLIVVSAMGKTTNALEKILADFLEEKEYGVNINKLQEYFSRICHDLFQSPSHPVHKFLLQAFNGLRGQLAEVGRVWPYNQLYDQVVSQGELISSKIIQAYLEMGKLEVVWMNACDLIYTDSHFREGKVDWQETQFRVEDQLAARLRHKMVITQGFIGGNGEGDVTTLGREGSDYSAAIFAHCLQAKSLTIWKDVSGVMNADPKKIPDAKLYSYLSYQEAAEMSKYGASVIHPKTIAPLAHKNIPLRVKPFLYPQREGTLISTRASKQLVPIIVFKPKQVLVHMEVKSFAFFNESHLLEVISLIVEHELKLNLMHKTATGLFLCLDDQVHNRKAFVEKISETYQAVCRENLQMISIKNANEAQIRRVLFDKTIILEEQNASLYQAICPV